MNGSIARSRPKFEFADGLRAIAALSVAMLHATTFTGHTGDADTNIPIIAKLAEIGNYAVPVFITLSGYVLMLPVVRTAKYEIRGGFPKYIWRRAKRILPPYYAALLFFGLLIWAIPAMQTGDGTAWFNKVPVTFQGVISHIFLVHNWSQDWIYQIDGPAWSVATEWQIYFIFPLILLPIWRWVKPWVAVVVALALGPIITVVFPNTHAGDYWMIGLFGIGMLAALITVRGSRVPSHWFGWTGIVVFAGAAAWMLLRTPHSTAGQMITDTLAGTGIALGLICMGQSALAGRPSRGRRILEWRPLVFIGLFSYSIYLIHSPLIALANIVMLPLNLPTLLNWLILVFVALPLAVAASYGFFLLVERHFITSHQKVALAEIAQEPAEVVQPQKTSELDDVNAEKGPPSIS